MILSLLRRSFLTFYSIVISLYLTLFLELAFALFQKSGSMHFILKSYLFFLFNIINQAKLFILIILIVLLFCTYINILTNRYKSKIIIGLLLSLLLLVYPYTILIEYRKFISFLPSNFLFIILFFISFVFLTQNNFFSNVKFFNKNTNIFLIKLLLFIFALFLYLLNQNYLFDSYPTFHYSLFLLSFLMFVFSAYYFLNSSKRKKIILKYELFLVLLFIIIPGIYIFSEKVKFNKKKYNVQKYIYYKYTISGSASVIFNKNKSINQIKKRCDISYLENLKSLQAVQQFKKDSNFPILKKGTDLSKYSVLFVIGDAISYFQTSLYNQNLNTTPFLLQLSKESINFKIAFSPSTRTISSMSSILTMDLPSMTPLKIPLKRPWTGSLSYSPYYIARIFKSNNFRTLITSDINLSHVFSGINKSFQVKKYCNSHKIAKNIDCDYHNIKTLNSFLTLQSKSKKKFFAYIHLYSPHSPYKVPEKDLSKLNTLNKYKETLKYVDQNLKKIYDQLEQNGQLDKTIIVFTSDHGEDIVGRKLKRSSRGIYSGATRIPLLVRIPGIKNIQVEKAVSNYHLFPWIFINSSGSFHTLATEKIKTNLNPVLKAVAGSKIIEMFEGNKILVSFIKGDFKYNWNISNDIKELYKLSVDPMEHKNLYNNKHYLKTVKRFKNIAKNYLKVRACKEKLEYIK